MESLSEKVTELQTKKEIAVATKIEDQGGADIELANRVKKKTCREKLWNTQDIMEYLCGLENEHQIRDVNNYLKLIQEGNDAICRKEMPSLCEEDGKDKKKRSRRFDRDFYRTCVSEGHRDIAYRFLLAPKRVGMKLEGIVSDGQFDFSKTMDHDRRCYRIGRQRVATAQPRSTKSCVSFVFVGSARRSPTCAVSCFARQMAWNTSSRF